MGMKFARGVVGKRAGAIHVNAGLQLAVRTMGLVTVHNATIKGELPSFYCQINGSSFQSASTFPHKNCYTNHTTGE